MEYVVSGFVRCASCGARISADRDRCLRCGEPPRSAVAPRERGVLAWLSKRRAVVIAGVGSLAVLASVVASWSTAHRVSDAAPSAVPAEDAPASKAAAATPRATASPVQEVQEPAASSLDFRRSGDVAFNAGDFASARARYEQALAKNPADPEAINNLGLILERGEQLNEAVEHFARAVQLVPDKWAYHFNLAHALGQLQQWDRAIAEYRVAATMFPDDYATQYNLAMAFHKKGDEQAAIPAFEKAIVLAPGEPTFHLSLGLSLEKTGRIADAQREYLQYLQMAPSASDAVALNEHLKALATGQSAAAPKVSPAS